jgi:hypothetical protein
MAEKSQVLETIYKMYVQRYGGAQPANSEQSIQVLESYSENLISTEISDRI